MAAVYAALNSVMYILQQIQHHPRPPITIQKQQMESLCEIISFLQDFLEKHPHRDIGASLESQIADAAYAAEDIIETHIVDQILAKSNFHDENNRIEKMKVIDDDQLPRNITANIIGSSTVPPPKRKHTNTMVRFQEVLIKILDRQTGHPPNLQVLPIVGMGGIGKTTLARNVYDYPTIVELLCEIISFFQDFLEKYSHRDIGDGKQEALESQIADAAYAAEDVIESHVMDQILTEKSSDYNLFRQDLQKVIQDMDLIKKEVVKIQEKIGGIDDDQLPRNIISMSANIIGSSTVPPTKRKHTNAMVGFDDVLIQIMKKLTGHPPNRQVLPIVGMGGIGKTTLARNVYDKMTNAKYFDICVWVTISQEYRLRDILLEALSYTHKYENKSSENELGVELHKKLYERRYLIVLDDMWSIEAWEKLMSFFPDNNNGSRILITTRLSNVSNHFGSCGFKMNFLDEDKSWDLFCKIVFPQDQCCPQELEETGKKIARNCKGLPLSIIVIGGLLANSEMAQQHWEYVADNLNSIVNLKNDKHCLNVLALSYNYLPIHLKPCFLYMGVYPEDSEIRVSQLIYLWVSEGFLKPIQDKRLEVVAEEYLKDLIDRNLILVHKLGSSGKVKYCKIHDLLRDLCLREGERDKFLWVRTVNDLEGIQSQRRISIHEGASKENYHIDRVLEAFPSASLARSLNCDFKGVCLSFLRFRLVRVFYAVNRYYNRKKNIYSLEDMLKLMNSRYLDFNTELKSTSVFPSSIHLLWNLQTLIIHSYALNDLPHEIWEMSQLRHLEIEWWFSLPDPPNVPLIHEGDDFILRNLHTLKTVRNFQFSEEVIKRIPNIKKLRVDYHDFFPEDDERWWHNYCLNNLGLLNKLESLTMLIFGSGWSWQSEFLHNFAFPNSLKKLTLRGTYLHWKDMRMIGSLPHLQVLKLDFNSFRGPEWNPVEGEFLCLKFLQIILCNDLVHWNANRTHFPCLEKLVFCSLYNLKEIPLDIGEIPTLRSIELRYCSDSMILSAKNLLDEQVDLGNEDLQVFVRSMKNFKLQRLASQSFSS